MGTGLSGDFIGFSLDGKHSSSLGIVRVSDGSRYNENLLPTMADKTTQVGGADETYYFGTDYTQKLFTISIAFDDMTEEQYRELKRLCASKKLMRLVFDEAPYKYYMVKMTGNPTLKYVGFDGYNEDGEIERVYKGEGSLTLTAYYPYARCDHKFLEDKYYENIKNIHQWAAASGLKESKGTLDSWYNSNNVEWKILTYNPGDLEADYKLYFPYNDESESFDLEWVSVKESILRFNPPALLNSEDAHICVDSHANLVYGVDQYFKQTGTLYNKYITSGEFTKIPLGDSTIKSNVSPSELEYEYIYY